MIRCIFFGTPDFALPGLEALINMPNVELCLVVTQPDRPAGRGAKLRAPAVKELALAHDLPILQPEKIKGRTKAFLRELEAYQPVDIGVVSAFGQIMPDALLDLPKAGCVNLHASLLPRWRGAAPINRAIMAGDAESGVTLMRVESGLDSGAMYAKFPVKIDDQDDAGTLHDKLAEGGAELLRSHLQDIVDGKLEAIAQPEEGLTYAHKITKEEAEINWDKSAEEIWRMIRGLSPLPAAFTYFEGKRVKIFKASFKKGAKAQSFLPGRIGLIDKSAIEIDCGQGRLYLHELQLEGRKKMPVSEFLSGFNLRTGFQAGS